MNLRSVYTVIGDMDEAQRFYSEALGLSLAFRDGARWCQFRCGETSFALSAPEEAVPGASGSVPVFEAANLDEAASRVEAAGGTLLGRRDMGTHGTVLSCADPEGNPFQIFARAAA